MATVSRFVNTASSGGDGTTNGTGGSTAAYSSLSSWEANAGGSATDDYVVDCSGTAADVTAVVVDFVVNLTTGSVTIRGNRSSGDGFYTGADVISSAHYRLVPGNVTNALTLSETNATVDGIQVEAGHSGANGAAITYGSTLAVTIRKVRARNTNSTDVGIGANANRSGTVTRTIENCLIVGFSVSGIDSRVTNNFSPTINIYHNTIYGGSGAVAGIHILKDSTGGSPVFNVKGNAVANITAGADLLFTTIGSGTVNWADNATEDYNLGTTNEIDLGATTDAWTSPGTGAGDEFTVKSTSSANYNAVNPTLVTTDITDFTRDGSNHDVGCFEFQSAGATDLVVADSTHGHTADAVALTQTHNLVIADAVHAHAADNVALTQTHILAVADTRHTHTADNITLSAEGTLAVADALHGHAAENVVLEAVAPGDLASQDTLHAHTADNVTLTQVHTLVVADSLHAHTADNVNLSTGAVPTEPEPGHFAQQGVRGLEHYNEEDDMATILAVFATAASSIAWRAPQ